MNICEVFIRRPIATTLIMMAILIFGIAGYLQLPVSDLPNVDYPTINVFANLPGADPDTMAAVVALPLEKQFSTIPGVEQMTSNSGRGRTNITLQFDLSRDIDSAAQDVQAAIAAVRMPRDMPTPPQWRKSNPAAQSILTLALSSDTLPISTVDEYAETNIAQQHLHDHRRGRGGRGWRDEICRARARELPRTGHAADRHERSAGCGFGRQRECAGGHDLWPRANAVSAGHRPVVPRRRLCALDRQLPQRCAGAPVGCGRGH